MTKQDPRVLFVTLSVCNLAAITNKPIVFVS
jgi:hypothetical protein